MFLIKLNPHNVINFSFSSCYVLNTLWDSFNLSDKAAVCPCIYSTYTNSGGSENLNNLFKITLVNGRAPIKTQQYRLRFSTTPLGILDYADTKNCEYLLVILSLLVLFSQLKQIVILILFTWWSTVKTQKQLFSLI